MVRLAHWTLLALAACASAATATAADTQDQACVAPAAVADLESKIGALERSSADASARLDAGEQQWTSEKQTLEEQLSKEKLNHHSTATLLRNTKFSSDKTVALLEKKLEDAERAHREQLERLEAQVQALEATVGSVKSDLEAQAALATKREAEVAESREKLLKYAAKVKALEKDVVQSRKRNEALRSELESKEEAATAAEISLSALLSSYYDEGVVVASSTVAKLREQAEQGSGTLAKVVDTLESTKQTVVDSTDKFYSENLAATVDPILADLRQAADPHVQKYLPLVQEEVARAKLEALKLSHEGLQHAKAARLSAISALEANDHVRSHAQTIVDSVLVAVAIPLALVQFRFLLRVVWWLLSTAVCVLTLGCCCGRKRSTKRKTAASASASAARKPTDAGASGSASAQKKKPAAATATAPASATKRSGKKSGR